MISISGIKKVIKNRIDKFSKELYHQLELSSKRLSLELEDIKNQDNSLEEILQLIATKPKGIKRVFVLSSMN